MTFAVVSRTILSFAAYIGAGLCLRQVPLVWEEQSKSLRSPADAWMDALRSQLVVIDAGHGGLDGGTQGNGVLEKECALEIARRVEKQLRSLGMRTIMTRGGDTFVELEERSAIANRNAAALFLSIHLNADATSSATAGVETYYSSRKRVGDLMKLRDRSGLPPGGAVKDARSEWLASTMQRAICAATGAGDRRARDSKLIVVMLAECPAVLIECGYLTNEAEAQRLRTDSYQDKIAQAVATTARDFLLASSVNPRRGILTTPVQSAQVTGAGSQDNP